MSSKLSDLLTNLKDKRAQIAAERQRDPVAELDAQIAAESARVAAEAEALRQARVAALLPKFIADQEKMLAYVEGLAPLTEAALADAHALADLGAPPVGYVPRLFFGLAEMVATIRAQQATDRENARLAADPKGVAVAVWLADITRGRLALEDSKRERKRQVGQNIAFDRLDANNRSAMAYASGQVEKLTGRWPGDKLHGTDVHRPSPEPVAAPKTVAEALALETQTA